MGFTKKKFLKISTNSKLKKIGFFLKEYITTEKKELLETSKLLIEWLREIDNISLKLPENRYEAGILYHKILSILNKSVYEDIYPYDDTGKERKIFEIALILDNLRSPHNVGSIIRTSEGLGVKKIILTGITPRTDNPKVKRVSMNSIVDTVYIERTEDAVELMKKDNYKIVAIEKTKKSIPYNNFFIERPCFIFGNEEFGISQSILEMSEYIVHIPMYGIKNSLNVSVATGIIISNYLNLYFKNINNI
ncbi:MAG TPA: TrmH family RNA methyltransferase [Spirochaetota bacterium]|nr:TrmH family RNA methyltransferase [Spirochaetota bacterium]HOM38762.1 TrmH family RNA methyltransferase [Spirochaetota bacterium]HPQ49560.1 TrmH family RNA methyltransferase [Spirochaetota bacterium]